MGSVEQVVPSYISDPKRKLLSNRILVKHLPNKVSQEDINNLITSFGSIQKYELVSSDSESRLNVIYESPEQAQQAYDQLDNYMYQGKTLKVELVNRGNQSCSSTSLGASRSLTHPVRILVPSEYVGAIIGRKGQSIKSITTKCKARVDVHGRENSGLVEKVVSIYGQPENCSNACKEILQVIQNECGSSLKAGLLLKMLTNDRYCGRLIGKEGRMIKKIREETGTKIVVTNVQEMAGLYPDRVIAIRGNIDGMVQAELAISTKLAECIQQDLKTNQKFYPFSQPLHPGYMSYVGQHFANGGVLEHICQIQVPNSAVGAIIGVGGVNIKQMMRDSGAHITVEHKREADVTAASERVVTIRGTSEACWRANYFVFEKMKLEGFSGNDDVRLMTMIRVPCSTVGRIIGKGGKNVREIQRMTGSIIKLPHERSAQQGPGDEVVVEVHGNFMATQSAQCRIRAVVDQTVHHVIPPGSMSSTSGTRHSVRAGNSTVVVV
jgi:insulin-like growth factor 2 mRNA-binding protein 1